MVQLSAGLAALAVFGLGLRHGLDWDHLAAINDIVGSSESRREGVLQGTLYAFGHAAIVICFGLLAIVVGLRLPESVSRFLPEVVGLTLILLAVYLTASLVHHLRHGGDFKPKSRWMLIFQLLNNLHRFFHRFLKHPVRMKEEKALNYSKTAALTVGFIHGLGAETPTQVLVLSAAAGATGYAGGILILLIFVLGLFLSNSVIVVLSSWGFTRLAKNQTLFIGLTVVTAVFSFVVGLTFLTGKSRLLPAIFGG